MIDGDPALIRNLMRAPSQHLLRRETSVRCFVRGLRMFGCGRVMGSVKYSIERARRPGIWAARWHLHAFSAVDLHASRESCEEGFGQALSSRRHQWVLEGGHKPEHVEQRKCNARSRIELTYMTMGFHRLIVVRANTTVRDSQRRPPLLRLDCLQSCFIWPTVVQSYPPRISFV